MHGYASYEAKSSRRKDYIQSQAYKYLRVLFVWSRKRIQRRIKRQTIMNPLNTMQTQRRSKLIRSGFIRLRYRASHAYALADLAVTFKFHRKQTIV